MSIIKLEMEDNKDFGLFSDIITNAANNIAKYNANEIDEYLKDIFTDLDDINKYHIDIQEIEGAIKYIVYEKVKKGSFIINN